MGGYQVSRLPFYAPFDPREPQTFLLFRLWFMTPLVRKIDRYLLCSSRLQHGRTRMRQYVLYLPDIPGTNSGNPGDFSPSINSLSYCQSWRTLVFATSLLVPERLLLKVWFQLKRQFYPNEVGQTLKRKMDSNQLAESFFYAEFVRDTVQRLSAYVFRQLPSCITIDDNSVVCNYDRIAKRKLATVS
jgi:hypothetical protein